MYEYTLTSSERRKRCRQAIAVLRTPPIYPHKRLPNVREFRVEVQENYHPILAKLGISKRSFNPVLHTKPHYNRSINRYIEHQFRRLNANRSRPCVYWRIGEHLLNRSTSYAVLLLHETLPGWHRKYRYEDVWEIIKSMRTLNLRHYDHHQTGIPKNDGSTRYLNVPSAPWRLYQHGLQHLLQIWLSPYSHPHQHGFQHGRGTTTAWEQIHSEVKSSANIYEYDLKKFFDTINLDYLESLLSSTQMPSPLVRHMITWSRTPASNSSHSLLRWESPLDEVQDYRYHKTGKYYIQSYEEYSYWLDAKREAELTNPLLKRYDYFHGVAQGSPTSPLLSTLLLTRLLLNSPDSDVCQYADDGILYNLRTCPEEILIFPPESGISVNWSKSGWIKRNGTWLRPLKFLGISYVPNELSGLNHLNGGHLRTSTRTPKDLVFHQYSLIKECVRYDNSVIPYESGRESFEDWFKTAYHGLIMSCLYRGSYELSTKSPDFRYSYRSRSWSDLENRLSTQIPYYRLDPETSTPICINIFNSSSLASHSLANRINRELSRRSVTNFVY
jgi:hypothetical protein